MFDRPAPGVKSTPRLPFQFRPQPVAIDKLDLPHGAALLFGIIVDHAKRRGWRTGLTNPEMAAKINRTTRTVKRLLAILESHGLIVRELAADGRVRSGIKVVWEGVGHSRPVDARTVGQACPAGGTSVSPGLGHQRPTNSERPQSALSDGEVSLSGDEKTGSSPPLSGADIARAIGDGIAGRFAPMLFDDAKPEGSSAPAVTTTASTSPASTPPTTADATAKPNAPRAATDARVPHGGLDLFRAVKGAPAAAWSPSWGAAPKYTPADIQRQLRERRERNARAGDPSPAPRPLAGSTSAGSPQPEQYPESGRNFAVRL